MLCMMFSCSTADTFSTAATTNNHTTMVGTGEPACTRIGITCLRSARAVDSLSTCCKTYNTTEHNATTTTTADCIITGITCLRSARAVDSFSTCTTYNNHHSFEYNNTTTTTPDNTTTSTVGTVAVSVSVFLHFFDGVFLLPPVASQYISPYFLW